ncbi:hypothetical protein J2728_003252 [Caulobacter segnis]|nr:hypothetical protein [Caulobacter segnis]
MSEVVIEPVGGDTFANLAKASFEFDIGYWHVRTLLWAFVRISVRNNPYNGFYGDIHNANDKSYFKGPYKGFYWLKSGLNTRIRVLTMRWLAKANPNTSASLVAS